MHVVVIGSGIVGAACAVELLADGHEVSVVEPGEPGGRQAASYGNSGWISPASIIPMSMPGLWKKVPAFLTDPTGPLAIRWRHLGRLAPWLARFLMAGSSLEKIERTARLLSELLRDAPERHVLLSRTIGRPDLIRRQGVIYAYRDRAAFEAEALAWRLRHDNGVAFKELDAAALHALEPALAGGDYGFGIHVPDGAHCIDPGGYVRAVAEHAFASGARHVAARAISFDLSGGALRGVVTDRGTIACDRAVIAAGIHSKLLAARAGDKVPLESERGYHVVVPHDVVKTAMPVMPADGRMGNNPTAHGLRIAGQVELADVDIEPDWRRSDALLHHARRTYPELNAHRGEGVDTWMGHRPSTPDGLPVIGLSRASRDIVHAFGHGHVGLASGPISAELVARLVTGGTVPPFTDALSPRRFDRFRKSA